MIFRSKKKAHDDQPQVTEARITPDLPVPSLPPPLPASPPKLAGQMETIDTPTAEPPQAAAPAPAASPPPVPAIAADAPAADDPDKAAQIAAARARLHEAFGQITLAAISEPRYRSLSIFDMAPLFLEPLRQNKVAIASPANTDGTPAQDGRSAIAVWASVSPEVDAKIREQIDAGTFPIRLQPGEWNSGSTHWLIDIIAPSERLTTAVIANFRQVLKDGDLCIHPMVTSKLDRDVLEKLGARPMNGEAANANTPVPAPPEAAQDISSWP